MPIITCIEDLKQIHRRKVPKMFWDYCESGSYTEQTFGENSSDFHKIRLRQRVARDLSGRTTQTTMMGRKIAMPVALSPVGSAGMQSADGEIKAARAAEAFGVPTELESRHDFLWRIHAKAPARGEMVIFNRSHYEDVLVTRVRGMIDEETCQKRYNNILHFESLLHNAGISVLKCYLHISKSEQKKRLQARLDDPRKHWKLQPSDFDDRELWPKFTQAYEEALSATSTPESPWYVVPADSKPYRDSFVAGLIVQTLENMKLKPPKPSFDLSKVKLT